MRMKYKKISMPEEAYRLLKGKQVKMQVEIKDMTGKMKKIPMTKLLTTILRKPVYFNNQELLALTKKKKYNVRAI